MNIWLCFGYWLIVYFGLKFLDYRTEQVDFYYFPASIVATIESIVFWSMVELGVPFLGAIPLSSLTTTGLSKLISSGSIKNVWVSGFYLTVWIYLILALFYFLSFFAILLAGAGGGLSNPYDSYY